MIVLTMHNGELVEPHVKRMSVKRAQKSAAAANFRARWAELKDICVRPRIFHASTGNTSGRAMTYRRGDERAEARRQRRVWWTAERGRRNGA